MEWAIKSGMLAVMADATDDETLKDAGVLRAKGLIATLAERRRQPVRNPLGQGLEAFPAGFGACQFRTERKENAPGRRRLCLRSLRHDRQSHGAGDAQAARFSVHRFHHQGHGPGRGHRAGPRSQHRATWSPRACRDSPLRKELGIIVLAIRKSDGHMIFNPPAEATIESGDHLIVMGESRQPAPSRKNVRRGGCVKILTAAQMREVDRRTIRTRHPRHRPDGERRPARGRVSGARVRAARRSAHRGLLRQGQQWRRRHGGGAPASHAHPPAIAGCRAGGRSGRNARRRSRKFPHAPGFGMPGDSSKSRPRCKAPL